MKKLHTKLSQSSPAYRAWHQIPFVSVVHFCLLFAFGAFIVNSLFLQVSTFNEPQTAASINASFNRVTTTASTPGEATDHILVKFKNVGQARKAQVFADKKLGEKASIADLGVDIVTIDPGDTPDEVVQDLRTNNKNDIEFAEPDQIVQPALIPNDPDFSNEWNKTIVNAPAAWDINTGSSNVTVGIADTGVDCTHEDLAASCVPGWNFVNNNSDAHDVEGHGTAVAGVVAAIGNNNVGAVGTSWNAKIMPLMVYSVAAGGAYESTIAQAITYAADHGVKVVNNSFGGWGSNTSVLDNAAQYLWSKGGILVRSEGNSGADTGNTYNDADSVLVSGTDPGDNLYSWSSFGLDNDVAAPGCSNDTTQNGGGYQGFCGTSNSAPEVAGAIALMFSESPSATPQIIRDTLYSTADDLGTPGWDKYFGWGRIDVGKAMTALANNTTPPPPPPPAGDTTPPSVPQNVSASAVSSTQINVSWAASTDNVAVKGYTVYRNGTKITTTTSTNYTNTGLSPATAYTYTISAYDAVPNTSAQSSPASATTLAVPFSITSFSISTKAATTSTVSWTTSVPSTGTITYSTSKTNLSQSVSATTAGTTHTTVITGLSKNTTYYYQINATASSGSAKSAVSSFKTSPH